MKKESIPVTYRDGVITIADPYLDEFLVIKKWDEGTAKYCKSTTYGKDGDSVNRYYVVHRNNGRWFLAQLSEADGLTTKETDDSEIESLGLMARIETIQS